MLCANEGALCPRRSEASNDDSRKLLAQCMAKLQRPPLSGGSPREGARTREAREQRLAAGGRRLPRPVKYKAGVELLKVFGTEEGFCAQAAEVRQVGGLGHAGFEFGFDPFGFAGVVG